jgi:hypothetical protein
MLHTASLEIDIAPAGGDHLLTAHFQSSQLELNVWLTRLDSNSILNGIPLASEPCALTAGDSAGSKAHWAKSPEGLTFIVVGRDNETWDICLTLSVEETHDFLSLLREAVGGGMRSNTSLERTREG